MPPKTALLIIDNQLGFTTHFTHWGPSRSNPSYETNIALLLSTFRALSPPSLIIHIQHLSVLASSPLHPSKPGSALDPSTSPLPGEVVLTKTTNSAFIGTDLEALLRREGVRRLFVAGLTTDHCVSTSVRMAGNLGVVDGQGEKGQLVLVGDATACWQKDSESVDAEMVMRVHLESLDGEFAEVWSVEKVVEVMKGEED